MRYGRQRMIWIVVAVLVVGLAVGIFSTLRLVRWSPRPGGNDDGIEDRKVVTVTGTVKIVGEPLISPLSARRCVMFEAYANLYEWPKEGSEEGAVKDKVLAGQISTRKMIPFELETSVGTVRIEGTEADLELSPTPVFPRRPEREALFLREHERDERLIENATFEEITVDPDELISVQGLAIIDSPTSIRLVADGDKPLIIGTPRRTAVSS
jgi:hypothetical protein